MPSSHQRLGLLGAFMAAGIMVLIARLWWLQLTHWPRYTTDALRNRTTVIDHVAPRGLIYDRRGVHVLAENRDVWSVHVVPTDLPADEMALEREVQFLASTLSTEDTPVSTADVRSALTEVAANRAVEAVALGDLGQDLTFDQVAAIEERRLDLPGIVVATTTRRHYPYGQLAAQTIGYARRIGKEQLDRFKGYEYPRDSQDPTAAELREAGSDYIYRPDAIIGAEGAEALCEMDLSGDAPVPVLPGRRGRTIYEVDVSGAPQRLIAKREPQIGAKVYLTVDAKVQRAAELALREVLEDYPERMGAVVVMDTRNGDIIVLASEPCLDPNDWVSGLTGEQWKMALEAPGLPLFNKALSGSYPPGSIFKPVSVCAALETTKTTRHTTAVCTGVMHVGRSHEPFRCWTSDTGGHGPVDLLEAIGRSCNIWFYKTVLEFGLDPNDISRYAHRFGLGEVTGLGLKGEVAGEVPEPRYTQPRWQTGHSLHYVIGQEITVTPIQMARLCAAIANGGKLLKPNLVRRIDWPAYMHRKNYSNLSGDGKEIKVEQDSLELVRLGMRRAVTGEGGTAKALDSLGVPLAGKTGTAEHHPRKENHAWFMGFGPTDATGREPQYAVAVFVAQGVRGSASAVPVAEKVFRALFDLHEPTDPDYAMPKPMAPEQVARQRRSRIAVAKRWMAGKKAAEQKDKDDEGKAGSAQTDDAS